MQILVFKKQPFFLFAIFDQSIIGLLAFNLTYNDRHFEQALQSSKPPTNNTSM